MTKKEMKQRLQEEHSRQWEFARKCATRGFLKGETDREIAESMVQLSQRIGGICDAAMVLDIDLEKVSEIDETTVILWRMAFNKAA